MFRNTTWRAARPAGTAAFVLFASLTLTLQTAGLDVLLGPAAAQTGQPATCSDGTNCCRVGQRDDRYVFALDDSLFSSTIKLTAMGARVVAGPMTYAACVAYWNAHAATQPGYKPLAWPGADCVLGQNCCSVGRKPQTNNYTITYDSAAGPSDALLNASGYTEHLFGPAAGPACNAYWTSKVAPLLAQPSPSPKPTEQCVPGQNCCAVGRKPHTNDFTIAYDSAAGPSDALLNVGGYTEHLFGPAAGPACNAYWTANVAPLLAQATNTPKPGAKCTLGRDCCYIGRKPLTNDYSKAVDQSAAAGPVALSAGGYTEIVFGPDVAAACDAYWAANVASQVAPKPSPSPTPVAGGDNSGKLTGDGMELEWSVGGAKVGPRHYADLTWQANGTLTSKTVTFSGVMRASVPKGFATDAHMNAAIAIMFGDKREVVWSGELSGGAGLSHELPFKLSLDVPPGKTILVTAGVSKVGGVADVLGVSFTLAPPPANQPTDAATASGEAVVTGDTGEPPTPDQSTAGAGPTPTPPLPPPPPPPSPDSSTVGAGPTPPPPPPTPSPGPTTQGGDASGAVDVEPTPTPSFTPDRTPPPNRRAVTVSYNWNGDACQLTNKARFRVTAPTQLTDLDLWYNWRQGETAPAFMLVTGDKVVAQGQLARGACDPIQATWCSAHAQIAVDAAPGNYDAMTPDARVCMNARSRGIGFARVKGLQ